MSNNLDITTNDFENICRTCLCKYDLKPLYEKCALSTSRAEMLMFCTLLKFSENDGLPTKICVNCIHEINQAFSFAKHCETTDTILRNCVKTFNAELANNLSQSQTVEPIIKVEEEMQIEIKPEFNLPNIHEETQLEIKAEIILPNRYRTVDDVLEDFKFADKVKQEEKVKIEIKPEIILPNLNRRVKEVLLDYEYMEKVKQEAELPIENECGETYDVPATKSYEEDNGNDRDETNFEKADDPSSINSQIEEDPASLGQHENAQHSEPNDGMYQYQTCDKSFKRLALLKAHQKIHTGQKNENEYGETYDDPADESFEQDVDEVQNETYSENLYNPGSRPRCMSTNSQMEEGSLKEVDGSSLAKTLDFLKNEGVQPFACNVCGKTFNYMVNLKVHKRNHTGDKPYVCSVCSKAFTNSQHLIKCHMRIHTGEKPYSCQICSKKFTQLNNLKIHMRIHAKNTIYTCEICHKTFNYSAGLKYHMNIHTGERPYICGVCNKPHISPSSLRNHMRNHTRTKQGEWLYDCHTCGRAFNRMTHLNMHKRSHTDEKQYVCSVCSKAFINKKNLKYHMRLHTGEKSYSCEVCSKTFIQTNYLTMHMKIHTREKPYSCEICSKGFNNSSSLKYHMKIHTEENPYSCEICSKAFNNFSSFKYHMKPDTAKKPLVCEVCDGTFTRYECLTYHMSKHSSFGVSSKA